MTTFKMMFTKRCKLPQRYDRLFIADNCAQRSLLCYLFIGKLILTYIFMVNFA